MVKNDAFVYDHSFKSGWEKWYLLISDIHYDSPECDRKLLKKHLDTATERNAGILILGDIFDAMGGNRDSRTTKSDIRAEHQKENYFDLLVADAANFFTPYKNNLKLFTMGNHEFSAIKYHETSLTRRLIHELGDNIDYGRYTGFIRFKFNSVTQGNRSSMVMYYTHGKGGSAPVTRGVIETNRRSANIDADFFVSGHKHITWNVPISRVKLSDSNKRIEYEQEHIQLGTYKNPGEWEMGKEFGAPSKGGYWLRFYFKNHKIHYDLIRAK